MKGCWLLFFLHAVQLYNLQFCNSSSFNLLSISELETVGLCWISVLLREVHLSEQAGESRDYDQPSFWVNQNGSSILSEVPSNSSEGLPFALEKRWIYRSLISQSRKSPRSRSSQKIVTSTEIWTPWKTPMKLKSGKDTHRIHWIKE